MSDRLTCPVCERPGVPLNSERCPQCDADLTCFQALDTLAEHKGGAAESGVPAKTGNEGGGGSRRAVLLLILLLVLLAASFFFFSLKAKNRVHDLNQQVVALQTDLRRTRQNSELPKQVLCVLPDSEQVGSVEEESFAEDDPLIYEGDREDKEKHGSSAASAAMEKGKDAEKDAKDTQVAEVMVGTAGSAGSAGRNKAETVPMVFVEAMLKKLKKKEPEKKEFARPFENAAAKAETEAEEPWAEPSPLLPEEKWSEKTFLYLIKESDTLWDLAEHFYGDGKYYPVIMEQNPGLVISNIHDEEILRLFNERTVLEDIYTRRIEWRDGLVLWKHKVRAGETRKSIENRFASPGAAGSVFYEKTPNIHPGATVRIILH